MKSIVLLILPTGDRRLFVLLYIVIYCVMHSPRKKKKKELVIIAFFLMKKNGHQKHHGFSQGKGLGRLEMLPGSRTEEEKEWLEGVRHPLC